MLTDNPVLLANTRETPTLYCAQKTAAKSIITEESLVRANIASFGNDVGKVTNWITSMYDVQAQFPPDSEEYRILDYRIKCGQLYQQNAIDKTKGIICKPMPRYWHDHMAIKQPEDPNDAEAARRYTLNSRIVASKKPYFMKYVYPALLTDYNTYIKRVDLKSMCEFRMTIDELKALEPNALTERQAEFLNYYYRKLPVGINDCVMNKICRLFERELSGDFIVNNGADFDYTIMKNGCEYNQYTFDCVKKLFLEHKAIVSDLEAQRKKNRASDTLSSDYKVGVTQYFQRGAAAKCTSREQLCDIVLDICYAHSGTKQFAWDTVGDGIVYSLAQKVGGIMRYPILDPDGDISFRGDMYSMTEAVISFD